MTELQWPRLKVSDPAGHCWDDRSAWFTVNKQDSVEKDWKLPLYLGCFSVCLPLEDVEFCEKCCLNGRAHLLFMSAALSVLYCCWGVNAQQGRARLPRTDINILFSFCPCREVRGQSQLQIYSELRSCSAKPQQDSVWTPDSLYWHDVLLYRKFQSHWWFNTVFFQVVEYKEVHLLK